MIEHPCADKVKGLIQGLSQKYKLVRVLGLQPPTAFSLSYHIHLLIQLHTIAAIKELALLLLRGLYMSGICMSCSCRWATTETMPYYSHFSVFSSDLFAEWKSAVVCNASTCIENWITTVEQITKVTEGPVLTLPYNRLLVYIECCIIY